MGDLFVICWLNFAANFYDYDNIKHHLHPAVTAPSESLFLKRFNHECFYSFSPCELHFMLNKGQDPLLS